MKWLIPFLLLFATSCKNDKITIPEHVLPPEKMKMLLTDVHIADAVAEQKAQEGLDEKIVTAELHAQIFKNHGIGEQKFKESLAFYEANPKLMDEVYAEVLNELTKREAQANK